MGMCSKIPGRILVLTIQLAAVNITPHFDTQPKKSDLKERRSLGEGFISTEILREILQIGNLEKKKKKSGGLWLVSVDFFCIFQCLPTQPDKDQRRRCRPLQLTLSLPTI